MTTLSIPNIRDALATAIRAVFTGTGVTIPNVYGYPPDSPELVALCIVPAAGDSGNYIDYRGTFEGPAGALCTINLAAEIRVGGGQIDAARTLDAHLSAVDGMSLLNALRLNPTLTGLVEQVFVGHCSVPTWFRSQDEAREWISASFPITVRARRPAA